MLNNKFLTSVCLLVNPNLSTSMECGRNPRHNEVDDITEEFPVKDHRIAVWSSLTDLFLGQLLVDLNPKNDVVIMMTGKTLVSHHDVEEDEDSVIDFLVFVSQRESDPSGAAPRSASQASYTTNAANKIAASFIYKQQRPSIHAVRGTLSKQPGILHQRSKMLSYSLTTKTASALLLLSSAPLFAEATVVSSTENLAASDGTAALHDHHPELGANLEPHPDPNEEHHEGMIYIGRHHHESSERVGFDQDNGWRFIFGTSLHENTTHVESIPEHDLHHDAEYDAHGNVVRYHHPDFHHPEKTREQVLHERRHGNVASDGKPKPYGHVEIHALDGGVTPPKVAHIDPIFLDEKPVTNKEFAKFVKSTYYETEAEKYGWSFVLRTFLPDPSILDDSEVDPEAEHWVAVQGAYWRQPEGPGSSYKYREHHPVVHVSHEDAIEYCKWRGKRLPGEREYEAAARASNFGPTNRTVYGWGNDGTDWSTASQHANLWGAKEFPYENDAADGWRGTSPVKHYPPNAWGFYDMTGNVWEWMRGGKHKARIVRGGSYIDSLESTRTDHQHVATLGARATLHGTTTTGNVGFRCAKAPKRRTEHHYVWHDLDAHGPLAVEDQFGKRDQIRQRGWEDQFVVYDDEDYKDEDEEDFEEDSPRRVKRKVVRQRERYSDEL